MKISKKLVLVLVANALAVFAAFGGQITPEQTAAILALLNSIYLVGQSVIDTVSALPQKRRDTYDTE